MKRRISFIYASGTVSCFLAVYLTASSFCYAAEASGIKFSIELDKSEYTVNDAVKITFKLQNKGKRAVYVNKRFFLSSKEAPKEQKEVYLIITDPKGKEIPCRYSYETGLPKSDYFVLLEPNKDASSEYPRDLRGFFEIKEPGTYKIAGVYQNVYGAEIGLDVFEDKLVSGPLSFKVLQEKDQANN